jgi:hypothetical protein
MKLRSGLFVLVALAVGAACSSKGTTGGFDPLANAGSSSGSGAGGGGSSGGTSSSGGIVPVLGNDGGGGTTTPPGTVVCNVTDPTADMDKDGWSPNQGDCNDCDPNVNPGAIDVLHQVDGGTPTWGDEDCDGTPGDSAMACDTALTLADVDPNDAAKAIELCRTTTASDRTYGVISAAYMRANGTAFSPALQVGIQSMWGTNVNVQGGKNMLAMSTGFARSVGQAGACNAITCTTNDAGVPPTGFPEDDPACPPTPVIADDVALELQIRVPTNATGYSFNFKFYSFEYPDWVCDTHGYNDQFVALVTPPPAGAYVPSGSTSGNISFDSSNHPVSVNIGFFDVCDPTTPTRFAQHCKATTGATCPALPSPYCPLGTSELAGTGFDVWHSKVGPDGATRWLQTQAPAQPGSVITIRFAIWDAGNSEYDSTVLIDNFQWIATGGTIPVGTTPIPTPK